MASTVREVDWDLPGLFRRLSALKDLTHDEELARRGRMAPL
jgi:hypothetical protein